MRLAVYAACTLAVFGACAAANTYPIIGGTVNCRLGPGTTYDVKTTYALGHEVTVTCQTPGTDILGDNIWDLTSDGCFVADYYVKTGSFGYVMGRCVAVTGGSGLGSSGNGLPGPVVNDYPDQGETCESHDHWGYYWCECTSFVAWRINQRLGIAFTNWYRGYNWGMASTWADAARSTGVRVDNNPVPGCIAQTTLDGGHVAWVTGVSGDYIVVEDYNFLYSQIYHYHKLLKADYVYIHLKV